MERNFREVRATVSKAASGRAGYRMFPFPLPLKYSSATAECEVEERTLDDEVMFMRMDEFT